MVGIKDVKDLLDLVISIQDRVKNREIENELGSISAQILELYRTQVDLFDSNHKLKRVIDALRKELSDCKKTHQELEKEVPRVVSLQSEKDQQPVDPDIESDK